MTPAPVPTIPIVDLVYGAYQRGMYKTAFDLATKRAQDSGDPKAMTMLGELYANGMGVKRDYAKAVEWYRRAADGGDREAMFALAMLRLAGRGGPVDPEEATKLLASSAKLGNPKAAYNLALLYLDGQTLPQDLKRAAELFRLAADAGNPEAQYALATFYKEGTGVPKDMEKSVGCCRRRHSADNVDAEVEYAIALFNGTGTPKNEAAAVALCARPPKQNSPIAQNRLARVLVHGQGAPMDKIEGLKWHLVAKTAGKGDPMLDEALAQLAPRIARGRSGRAQMAGRKVIRLDATDNRRAPTGCARSSAIAEPDRHPVLTDAQVVLSRDHAAFSPYQRHGQSGATRRPQPQARPRRDREPSGLAEGPRQFRHPGRPARRGDAAWRPHQGSAGLRLHR